MDLAGMIPLGAALFFLHLKQCCSLKRLLCRLFALSQLRLTSSEMQSAKCQITPHASTAYKCSIEPMQCISASVCPTFLCWAALWQKTNRSKAVQIFEIKKNPAVKTIPSEKNKMQLDLYLTLRRPCLMVNLRGCDKFRHVLCGCRCKAFWEMVRSIDLNSPWKTN